MPNASEKTKYTRLPFFNALNPASDKSGITQVYPYTTVLYDPMGHEVMYPGDDRMNENLGKEIPDETVYQQIKKYFNDDFDWVIRIGVTFELILGDHYALHFPKGRKGLLDFLIFPLVARKLIADLCLEGHNLDERFASKVAFGLKCSFFGTIAAVLESIRFSAAVVLAVAFAPVSLFISICKYCSSGDGKENDGVESRLNGSPSASSC